MLYNALGFWFVGVATGALLTFAARLRLVGLWLGIMLGVGTTAALNIQSLVRVKWAREADAAVAAAAAAAVRRSERGASAGEIELIEDAPLGPLHHAPAGR
jgi:hypothetical protein